MSQAHFFISGYVQGVGYRQFVKNTAKKLGLTGWVKNSTDGRVEVLLQGEKENIEKIGELLRKGSMLAEVKDMQIKWENITENFSSFTVLL